MAKPPAKKRPYDAMYDESSRAITAMPYTEKPKPKAKAAPKKPAPKSRPYDAVKDEPTSRPFKRGGKVVRKAGGGITSSVGEIDTGQLMRGVAKGVENAKPQTFSEAFRAARKDPDKPKTFTWNGKSYSTALAGEGSAPAKKASSAPSTSKASTSTSRPNLASKPPVIATAPAKPDAKLPRTPAPEKKAGLRKTASDVKDYLLRGDPKYRGMSRKDAFRAAFRDSMGKAKGGKVKAKKRYV